MEFFKNLNITGVKVVQLIAVLGVAFLVLSLLLFVFTGTFSGRGLSNSTVSIPPMADTDGSYLDNGMSGSAPSLSYRNVESTTMYPKEEMRSTGDTAESFEVSEYALSIETRDHRRECGAVLALKERADTVFENANEHDRGCTFTFKVQKDHVPEVLSILKGLNPRELVENTQTIKQEVDDYTSEIDILKNKLASLDTTLADATASYQSITALASETGNVEQLAKIIESKLTILERLTSARIEASDQIERMERAKNQSLDRVLYTYFTVSVYENKFVDAEILKDSWKASVRSFVNSTNVLIQDITIGFLSFLLLIVKFLLYFVVIVFVARFGWKFLKDIFRDSSVR